MRGDPCVLYDEQVCRECGECDVCDLDETQKCTNCMRCIQTGAAYRGVRIDAIIDLDGNDLRAQPATGAPAQYAAAEDGEK